MARSDPGYKPLPLADRWRLNRAIQSLRSPFHSVRLAAHKEIQKILARRGGRRAALPRERAPAMWRRVRYGRPMQCHGCGSEFHDKRQFAAHALEHNRTARQAVMTPRARASEHDRARRHAADFIAAGHAPAPRQPGEVLRGRDLKARARAARNGAPERGAPARSRVSNGVVNSGTGRVSVVDSHAGPRAGARSGSPAPAPRPAPSPPGRNGPPLPSEITRAPRAPRQSRIRLPRLNRAH